MGSFRERIIDMLVTMGLRAKFRGFQCSETEMLRSHDHVHDSCEPCFALLSNLSRTRTHHSRSPKIYYDYADTKHVILKDQASLI
jgi:hypothetical protein